jgi:dTDP-4-dehydrorhamnose reductase
VYAPQGRNFLLTMLRVMRANGIARVVADQVGTPTSAPALAQTLWKLIELPALTGIHHWTDAGVASWYDFAVAIAEEGASRGLVPDDVSVVPITTAQYPTPARRPAYSVLDKESLIERGLAPLHWRKRLREVLLEVRDA